MRFTQNRMEQQSFPTTNYTCYPTFSFQPVVSSLSCTMSSLVYVTLSYHLVQDIRLVLSHRLGSSDTLTRCQDHLILTFNITQQREDCYRLYSLQVLESCTVTTTPVN
uniref:Uncharacterized protein n=1 Tax=Cacopsylla melanoneura TaxID=428564 RepID=A0A8D8UI50_9HEMI